MNYSIQSYASFGELPPACAPLVDALAAEGLFGTAAWFAYLMEYEYTWGHALRLHVVSDAAGRPQLLVPLRHYAKDYVAPGAALAGAVNHPENYAEMALAFADGADRQALLAALFRHLRGKGDGAPVDALRLWPFGEDSPRGRDVRAALRRAGFWVQTYFNSYNRYEDTAGLSYADYFAQRSANLRYSVRRRQRGLARAGTPELAIADTAEGIAALLPEYIRVARGSWKEPETMVSDAILALIRLAAAQGAARLGVLRLDGEPVATQFWIVASGVAHCARLAYRQEYRPLAVGVVLTNAMIERVLDVDRVAAIDFGFGPEDFKGGWMKTARDYFGIMAFNPTTRLGLWHGLRNLLGQPVKRLARHLRGSGDEGAAGAQR